MRNWITITILSIIIISCCSTNDKKFEFNNNESRFLSCYQVNDTIFFQNIDNDIDSFTILKIDSAKGEHCYGFIAPRPTGKSCWVTIKHLPNDKWHRVTINGNTGDTTSIDYRNLIFITKDPENNKTYTNFEFKNFIASDQILNIPKTDTITINNKAITNYYKINHSYPDRVKDSLDIKTIIWTEKLGLIAYQIKNGDWWTKK